MLVTTIVQKMITPKIGLLNSIYQPRQENIRGGQSLVTISTKGEDPILK